MALINSFSIFVFIVAIITNQLHGSFSLFEFEKAKEELDNLKKERVLVAELIESAEKSPYHLWGDDARFSIDQKEALYQELQVCFLAIIARQKSLLLSDKHIDPVIQALDEEYKCLSDCSSESASLQIDYDPSANLLVQCRKISEKLTCIKNNVNNAATMAVDALAVRYLSSDRCHIEKEQRVRLGCCTIS